ncbi:MAG: class I adenylate-forming enzyme family protein [Candidatus Sumerlaeota bacterium]|nr:class I adenylate-forming enzyme family protein [Candidatus Sumerlaeota bacterium]
MKAFEIFNKYLDSQPDTPFYIDIINDKTYSRVEFSREALKLCSLLREIGVAPGDKVAAILPNCAEFALLYFAALYSQVTMVPLNPILHPSEVEYILKTSAPKAVFVCPSTAGKITPEIENLFSGSLFGLRIRQESAQEIACAARVFESADVFSSYSPAAIDFGKIRDDHILTITYTSGTTQVPKGVMHRFENFVYNALRFVETVGIGPENRFYGVLSQAYMGGFYNLLILAWVSGATIGFSKSFDALTAITFWEPPMKYNLNTLWLVPTIMAVLMKVDRSEKGRDYARRHTRLVLAGTAPLPVQLRKDFEQRYGIRVYENYGLSEILFVSVNTPREAVIDGSVGKPLQGVAVAIRNEAGGDLAIREEGEIIVKTPECMTGYYKEETAGEKKAGRNEEWFSTGDIGFLDENGNLYITGRKKDLIIRGGINISPSAIENIIMEHPAISQVAVVGIPHDLYGEDIAAVVKLKQGFSLGDIQKELEDLCSAKLSQIRKPSAFFEIEEIPASTTSKIQKNKLRQMLRAKLGK